MNDAQFEVVIRFSLRNGRLFWSNINTDRTFTGPSNEVVDKLINVDMLQASGDVENEDDNINRFKLMQNFQYS